MSIQADLVRTAYELRLPDARERAARAKAELATLAARAFRLFTAQARRADQWTALAEAGIDYKFRAPDKYRVPIEEARRALDLAWAVQEALHAGPEAMAMAEVLRLEAAHGRMRLGEPDEGPTAETVLQARQAPCSDPVLRLFEAGKLEADEVRAAREIQGVFRHITSGLQARTMPYAIKTEVGEYRWTSGAEAREWYALLHAQVYRPWAASVAAWLPMVLAIVVHAASVSACRERWRIGYETLTSRISQSLCRYVALRRGWAPEEAAVLASTP